MGETSTGTGGWRRAGWAGAAIGVLAAGAAAGVAVERLTVGRSVRQKARLALDSTGPYGTLRGTPGRALADDGTVLVYETEEPEGTAPDAPTVVFCHGFCLTQDSWHFQRAALRGRVRAVYWDQRSHGRSARGASQAGPDGVPVTIDRLGRDLRAVIDAAAPRGPLVLVGHSMGGMTIMALAGLHPELVRERVVGVALVGTSAGELDDVSYGLPPGGVRAVRRVLPGVLRALGAQAELVERGRRATADLFTGLVKKYSFASKDVDPAVVRFAERMIESTPVDVVAEFYPAFAEHEKRAALAGFRTLPGLALAGDQDLVTPVSHTEAIAAELPGAELVVVPEAGHLVMLERPGTVDAALWRLLVRAGVAAAGEGPASG
ncbi:alpha/beta fold hydrolase [Streptomyces termitum]|uniref:Lipase n=1 Tax=Streptomyces termitum TaxID=67368 RepID=A0A918W507_9ACTN|nr:alpha/beta hydrolase [Streptomyces termitum]GHA66223.1 lipase [Streptomyces termitum]